MNVVTYVHTHTHTHTHSVVHTPLIWSEILAGIYFSGLAVLRAIQHFICHKTSQCDVIVIIKFFTCTVPAARRTSLIVSMEFAIESCVCGHHFSTEFSTPEVGEELACLSMREGDPNDV